MNKNKNVCIQNIVITGSLGCAIDLKQLAWKFGGKYTPRTFAACQLRISYPKTTALVFSSGKIVCPGAKNEPMARLALYMYMRMICKIHRNARLTNVQIQNIVASGFLDHPVNLLALANDNYKIAQYDPDIFPGARISLKTHKGMQALVFLSGKVIVTGAKRRDMTQRAWLETIEIVTPFLRTHEQDTSCNVTHQDVLLTKQALARVTSSPLDASGFLLDE